MRLMLAVFLAVTCQAVKPTFAFDLLTRHEPIRPQATPDGLLYCLSKGHHIFIVDEVAGSGDRIDGLIAHAAPVEQLKRHQVTLIGGLIPVSGEGVPPEGRRLYVRSVGWVDHLVCIKGVPI